MRQYIIFDSHPETPNEASLLCHIVQAPLRNSSGGFCNYSDPYNNKLHRAPRLGLKPGTPRFQNTRTANFLPPSVDVRAAGCTGQAPNSQRTSLNPNTTTLLRAPVSDFLISNPTIKPFNYIVSNLKPETRNLKAEALEPKLEALHPNS